jgi:hypothetical protein
MNCTIEPDLEDSICHPGKQFGAHCLCSTCEDGTVSKLWFEKYNGFVK